MTSQNSAVSEFGGLSEFIGQYSFHTLNVDLKLKEALLQPSMNRVELEALQNTHSWHRRAGEFR